MACSVCILLLGPEIRHPLQSCGVAALSEMMMYGRGEKRRGDEVRHLQRVANSSWCGNGHVNSSLEKSGRREIDLPHESKQQNGSSLRFLSERRSYPMNVQASPTPLSDYGRRSTEQRRSQSQDSWSRSRVPQRGLLVQPPARKLVLPPQLLMPEIPSSGNRQDWDRSVRSRYEPNILSPPSTRRVTRSPALQLSQSTACPPMSNRQDLSGTPLHRPPTVHEISNYLPQSVGDARFQIYRLKLPMHLVHLLDTIVLGCESYAATLKNGWHTNLYSLTRQDIPLREVPQLYQLSRPVEVYILKCMHVVYGIRGGELMMDFNQPHVLKYSEAEGHRGVEPHHDKCDITANLCLSRTTGYVGGGTFFPSVNQVVRLEFGEFLLHPGHLVHSGMNIASGTRHLYVMFCHRRPRNEKEDQGLGKDRRSQKRRFQSSHFRG